MTAMRKYYRVQARVNLDAIYENLERTRLKLDKDTKLMAIIKADGYGHGAVPIAWTIDSIVDAYGVAIIEEAVELRKAGVTKPILVLGHTCVEDYEQLIQYDITQTVYSLEMAERLSQIAVSKNNKARIHIKLDTGMSRIGFKDNDESILKIQQISTLEGIEITGLFTHFACADMTDKVSTINQYKRYQVFAKKLSEVGIQVAVKHVSNSAAIIDLPDTYLNMVRSGISTYGLYPSSEVNKENLSLRPAMELLSKVIHVHEVEPGTGISYGSTYVAKEKISVATIPVGYADGYPRALSNKGYVLIHGKKAPILGRICMDQFMVDVTGIPETKKDDDVILVGIDGDKRITVEELADMAYSFNYEFVCDISKRVPRVYIRNGAIVGELSFQGNLEGFDNMKMMV